MPGLGRPSPSLYVRPPGGPGRQVFFKLSPSACWSCCPSANIMQSAVTISNRGKEESWHKGLRLMGGGRRAQRRLVTAFAGYQCSKACGSTSLLQPISCKKKRKEKEKRKLLRPQCEICRFNSMSLHSSARISVTKAGKV